MKNICPLCQSNNRCGKDSSNCWCMSVTITEQMKEQIKVLNIDESCICKNCLQKLSKI